MQPTRNRRAQGWKLSTKIVLAVFLCVAGMMVTANTADAKENLSFGSSIYNNSPIGLGIVTTLGQGYSYVMQPYKWTPPNAKGGYTGSGWCTNIYYDMGDGVMQYRFQVRGPSYWSVAYVWIYWVRADSWRC